jgi:DNA polymerase epsilon subunit 2
VFLSDVHLDNSKVLQKVESMLKGCEENMDQVPAAFVFMGNFTSRSIGEGQDQCSAREYCSYFDELISLLLRFPKLLRESRFVFVPGPSDLGEVAVLPRARLPNYLTKELSRRVTESCREAQLTFVSNPCRIQYFSQEIVIFRNDMLSKLRRHSINRPNDALSVPEHLLNTLICQSHLCPLPFHIRPIAWAHDAALRLYPLPQLIITGDRYDQYKVEKDGTTMINPGSFHLDGSFIFYVPAHQDGHFSRVPDVAHNDDENMLSDDDNSDNE